MKEYKETEESVMPSWRRELTDLEKAGVELHQLITDLIPGSTMNSRSGIVKINAEFGRYFHVDVRWRQGRTTVVKEPKRRKKTDSEELGEALSSGPDEVTGEAAWETRTGPKMVPKASKSTLACAQKIKA